MKILYNKTHDTVNALYYRQVFFLNPSHKWIATNSDGAIYSFSEKPEYWWNSPEEDEASVIWMRSSGNSTSIGKADLQDTDWKDTLVKV